MYHPCADMEMTVDTIRMDNVGLDTMMHSLEKENPVVIIGTKVKNIIENSLVQQYR